MFPPLSLRSPAVRVYLSLLAAGVAWALYTNHTWEDYYITYRASKNLATGHGLTFTAGERVHSFTSPIGVLLPALASFLTLHRSDYVALWIFRLMSIGAYAGAGVMLWKLAKALNFGRFASVILVVLFATDAKIVDFSTNGMETGFLLLFLSWTLFALISSPPKQTLHLGLAWAGLMWTRPDSFIYIFVLALGSLLFLSSTDGAATRSSRLLTFVRAGVLTSVLYSPWLIWAWRYYGSPIPHTVTAKGLFQESTTVWSFMTSLAQFPRNVLTHRDILAATFMPSYSANTGWPALALGASYWIAAGCLIVWLVPGVRRTTRLLSFAFFGGQFYLSTYVKFPVPWYIPTVTVFAFLVLTGLLNQLLELAELKAGSNGFGGRARAAARTSVIATSSIAVLAALTLAGLAAHQLKLQQTIIEHGQRREIGRWLRSHAKRTDTVFLEPLGYIGFYSNLKMLDYPGLSSPEVVAARRRASARDYPGCWPELIIDLSPTWLVLRNYEATAINEHTPELLESVYTLARTFDVREKVNAIERVQGRGYLLNDAHFEVYRRNEQPRRRGAAVAGMRQVKTSSLLANEAFGGPASDRGLKIVAHAPSRLVVERLVHARWLSGSIGIEAGAYENSAAATDGASFQIFFLPSGGGRELLFRRDLNPRDQVSDRGPQPFSVDLPGDVPGLIQFEISPGPQGNGSFDWTYWSFLRFELPGPN